MDDSKLPSREEISRMNRHVYDRQAILMTAEERQLEEPEEDIDLFLAHLPGKRMLDTGCGWGRYIQRFLDHGVDYVGVDLSMEMIRLSRCSHPNLAFSQMNFRSLAFPDQSFDGTWSCCSLDHDAKDMLPKVLREQHRVLKDGGILVAVMADFHESQELLGTSRFEGNPLFVSYFFPDEFALALTKAEFTVLDVIRRPYNGAMAFLAEK